MKSISSPARLVDAYGDSGLRQGSDSLNGGSLSPPVDRRRGGEHEAAARRAARAASSDALGPDHVDVGVARRLGQRRPHARQRRQVDDHVAGAPRERPPERGRVAEVALDEREPRLARAARARFCSLIARG